MKIDYLGGIFYASETMCSVSGGRCDVPRHQGRLPSEEHMSCSKGDTLRFG